MSEVNDVVIDIKEVRKAYRMGDVVVTALNGVSLQIQRGEFLAIMGPSGSGKSTLMHLLGLLDVPDSGSYKLLGKEVAGFSEDELASLRTQTVGFVFQQFNLLARTSAVDNVALPLLYSAREENRDEVVKILESVGLGNRLDHKPSELSGGQQQRVAIGRALVNHPRILFADEPTGNLDSASEKEIMGILRRLNDEGITVVIVTHEEEIAKYAKRVIRMRDGSINSDVRNETLATCVAPKVSSIKEVKRSALSHFFRESFAHVRQGNRALLSNKVRTTLSTLGILIGVAAVVAMLAIGRGAKESIEKDLASLGSNLLVLMPGSFRQGGVSLDSGTVTRFSLDDAKDILRKIPTVKRVNSSVSGRARIAFGNKNWSTQVTGTTPDYEQMRNSQAMMGRFFNADDDLKRSRVAVLGTTVVREIFGERNPVGEFVKINKVNFQVIGVMKPKGSNGFRDQDDAIIVPLQTAMRRLLGKDYVDQIDIEVSDPTLMETTEGLIEALITEKHRIPQSQEGSFQIRNMAEIQAAVSSTSRVLGMLLACIAAISLFVGGIGIMNIMLVSVTERTREIGLRKAVGARGRDILLQFLVEAVLVSVTGGVLGILLGWIVTLLVSNLAGWPTSVSASSIALAFGFSAGIGVVFGLWPARKAASLSPIIALRYE